MKNKISRFKSSPYRGIRGGLFILFSLLLCSCGSKPADNAESIDEEVNELVETNEYKENGLNKLRASNQTLDTEAGYRVSLLVEPDERLPRVANDNFGPYSDNRATVVVTRDADTLLVHRFVKTDFADYLDQSLGNSAILDGLTLTNAAATALTLEASVSVPHSDEQTVVAVTLSLTDGKTSMQRVATTNDSFGDEE
ncbi:MAG: DUF4738 domain-containing protein [Bacteroidaceae bacterium]|nr:DUF4738 domain-containing protein [Bacteroidaceae bacterium]